jgi:hypothetical protein
VQLEPLEGKVDSRRLLEKQKMADSNHITANPIAQTANPPRVLPDGTFGVISPLNPPRVYPVSLP